MIEDNDEFKAPMIDFNVKREYDELSNKIFTSKEGKEYVIDTAIQTISFSLDEKGGKIKSEATTDVKTMAMPNMNEPRYFNIDNTFNFTFSLTSLSSKGMLPINKFKSSPFTPSFKVNSEPR